MPRKVRTPKARRVSGDAAAELTPEVIAIVLSGWGAKPPASAGPSDRAKFWQMAGGWGIGAPEDEDDFLFEAWQQREAGLVRVWNRHREFLLAIAEEWNVKPPCRLGDRLVYYGEWCSARSEDRGFNVEDEDE